MLKFILKRFFYGVLVILGVMIVVFFIFHILPGDPVNMLAGVRTDVMARKEIARELGLDQPLMTQLGFYMKDLSPVSVHEDTPANEAKYEYAKLVKMGEEVLVLKVPYLRRSFQTGRRVDEIISDNLEGTLWLALAAMTFATCFGILFGLIAALNQNTALDHFLITISVGGISVPSFVAAILISITFGYYLADYTGLNMQGSLFAPDVMGGDRKLVLKNIILPAFTLGLRPLAIIVQLTRSSMIDVLSQDYIRTAKAKGLSKIQVIAKHALKNALNPVITAVSGWLATLTAGAFFIEYIFSWKGLGSVTINAVYKLDFLVVMGATLIVAIFFVVINIIVDIMYALLDPRVRLN